MYQRPPTRLPLIVTYIVCVVASIAIIPIMIMLSPPRTCATVRETTGPIILGIFLIFIMGFIMAGQIVWKRIPTTKERIVSLVPFSVFSIVSCLFLVGVTGILSNC